MLRLGAGSALRGSTKKSKEYKEYKEIKNGELACLDAR